MSFESPYVPDEFSSLECETYGGSFEVDDDVLVFIGGQSIGVWEGSESN